MVLSGEAGFEFFVDAEAGGAVGDLPQQRGREAVVETGDAVVAHDMEDGAGHGFGGVAGAHLEADFDCCWEGNCVSDGVLLWCLVLLVRMTYLLLVTDKLTEIERMCDGGSHAAGASSEPEGIVYCLLLGLGRGRRRRDHGLICCRLFLHGCLRCLFRDRRYGGLFGIRRRRPSKASGGCLHCCLYTSEQKSTRVLADQGSAVCDGACYGASVEIGRDERIPRGRFVTEAFQIKQQSQLDRYKLWEKKKKKRI